MGMRPPLADLRHPSPWARRDAARMPWNSCAPLSAPTVQGPAPSLLAPAVQSIAPSSVEQLPPAQTMHGAAPPTAEALLPEVEVAERRARAVFDRVLDQSGCDERGAASKANLLSALQEEDCPAELLESLCLEISAQEGESLTWDVFRALCLASLAKAPPQQNQRRPAAGEAPRMAAAAREPPQEATEAELAELLEASRARVAGFQRAMAREDKLLREQGDEVRSLEQLLRGLEEEGKRRTLEMAAAVAAAASAAVVESREESLPTAPSVLGNASGEATDGPLSLEDLKKHLGGERDLRRRIGKLEGELDAREDQVSSLCEQLRQKHLRHTTQSFAAELQALNAQIGELGELGITDRN